MKRRRIVFFMGLLVVILVVRLLVLPFLGSWLILDQEPKPTDAMVMLMGHVADRVLEVHRLHQAGFADMLIMVEPERRFEEVQLELGVSIPSNVDIAKEVLINLGLREDCFILLPGGSNSTRDEAKVVRRFLEGHREIRSILLVTSSAHSRRAFLTFRREFRKLDREVQIFSRPSQYSEFQAKGWYRDRESAKAVFYEYVKMAAWCVGL